MPTPIHSFRPTPPNLFSGFRRSQVKRQRATGSVWKRVLQRIKSAAVRGIGVRIGPYRVALNVRRSAIESAPAASPVNLAAGHLAALEARFPALKTLRLNALADDAAALLDFYNAYLPLIHEPARGAHLRTLLCSLRDRATSQELRHAATMAIARSDLADGMPDRAQILLNSPDSRSELVRQTADLEAHYGAPLVTETWPNAERGAALLYYLENHPELVRGKDVLHIAPEPEPRAWLAQLANSYRTMDGIPGNVDFIHDITAIALPSASFDVVLCHRVLEHVLDDRAALAELRRILRPGALLNLSVPQALHRERTAEWIVPDASHHGHLRHYGRDLTDRIAAAGFSVELEPWLLGRSREELLARHAYPMRMYNAYRN